MDLNLHLAHLPTYLYVIVCKDHSFYVGITSDLERRFGEHVTPSRSAPYVRQHRGFRRVVTAYLFPNRAQALIAETFAWYYLGPKCALDFNDEQVETFLNHYYPQAHIGGYDDTLPCGVAAD